MIAYNHYIKFIPELEDDKKVEGLFVDTVTVQESISNELEDKLKYELKFFNNQERELRLCTDRELAYTQKKQLWAFEVKDVVTFFWHSGTLRLEYIKHDNFTEKLLEYWCLHIVLPVFFTIEETFDFLHAGAVEVDDTPILFVAQSFGGKSTMTDYFMKQGHSIVSDDKVAIFEKENQFYAVSSHPHYRPYRKIEDLGYFIEKFVTVRKPIRAVYELEKVESDAKIRITELTGMEKFISLRYASEMNLFFQKSKRFEFLMKMGNSIPIYKVSLPWKLERLNEVYSSIVEHVKSHGLR